MSPVFHFNSNISQIALGNNDIAEAYLGNNLVYQKDTGPPPDFDPRDLFASGELGCLYEITPNNVAANTDGSGAVAVGERVAWLRDLSPNLRHATNATVSQQPILRQDGNLNYYLEYSQTDSMVLQYVEPSEIVQPYTYATKNRFWTQQAGSFRNLYQSAAIEATSGVTNANPSLHSAFAGSSLVSNVATDTNIFRRIDLFNTANSYIRIDGDQDAAGNVGGNRLIGAGGTMRVGRGNSSSNQNLYKFMLINRELTPQEVTDMEIWLL